MSENLTLVGPTVFVLQVVKPSGVPVADAVVSVEWEELQNPYAETPRLSTYTTDGKGQVQIPILDPKEWWIDPDGGTLAKLEVSKDFHGPIVPYGTVFTYQPAKVEFRIKPKGDEQVSLRNEATPTQVLWGRTRVLKQQSKPSVIEITLMEGGELGREHPNVRTRRLSASHRQTQPPSAVPQIDEELLFHIAHGGLALDPATDYKFKVTPPPAGQPGPGTIEVDLPPTPTGGVPSVPRVTARNSVAGGLRFMHLLQFTGGDRIRISGEAGMRALNPRLMVGAVRFARALLRVNSNLQVVLTSGFGRAKDDAHGNGRAVDFAGLMTATTPGLVDPKFPTVNDPLDPHCVKKTKPDWQTVTLSSGGKATVHEKACVAEQDFIVLYHWGMVKLLVDTPSGRIRRAEDAGQYKNAFRPNTETEELVFRLADLPTQGDRHPTHVLTDSHYELARDLFGAVYAFFAQEFAHRETFLGPTSEIPTTPTAIRGVTVQSRAQLDDAGGAPLVPGPVQGFVLHPDYPAPDGPGPKRQSHANHVHANLGGVRPGSTHYER